MDFFIPPDEVTDERTEEIIDKVARVVVKKYGITDISIFFFESTKFLSLIGGEIGRMFLTPWLGALGPDIEYSIHEYISFFEDKKNIDKLIRRVEELDQEIKQQKKMEKEEGPSIFQKIKIWIKKL